MLPSIHQTEMGRGGGGEEWEFSLSKNSPSMNSLNSVHTILKANAHKSTKNVLREEAWQQEPPRDPESLAMVTFMA